MGKMYRYPHDYCPYCYHKIETYSFYCPKCVAQHPETAVTQPDKNIPLDYRGIPLCSNCGSVMRICCSNDACRNQNNIIPPEPTAVVAIAGFSSSGKSTYLLDVVASKSSETGVLVSAKSHALIEWREQNLHRIQQSDVLDSTQKHADNFSSVVGFQSVAKKDCEEIILSLTDRPGEESQEMERLASLNYLFCADYIILLLDLLNLPGMSEELRAKDIDFPQQEATAQSNEIAIENIIGALEQQQGKKGKKIPLFIGVAKWDYAEKADLCPPGFSIGCEGADTTAVLDAKGRLDKKRWNLNSNLIRNFLMQHNEGNLVNKAERYLKTVNYYAFSCFGAAPQVKSGIVTPPIHHPRHIMDPFYWIMKDMHAL